MSEEDRRTRLEREIEQLLKAMNEEGVAGGTIGVHGMVIGQPNWEERTKDQRFAQKVKTHGYPLGFAKSTYRKRDLLVEEYKERIEKISDPQRELFEATREAVAWALDAERFLGSFSHGTSGNFPVEAVDEVAEHLLVWLEERGFGVFPLDSAARVNPLVREATLYIDVFSGMVLDKPTHTLYTRVNNGELNRESLRRNHEINTGAAQWCASLRLSSLAEGESAPPSGTVGQYGRYGCVLTECASNESIVTHDVCCVSYEPRDFGRFIRELVSHRYVKLVHSKLTDTDLIETVSGLHPLSLQRLGVHLDTDLPLAGSNVDMEASIEWGRIHSRRI